MVEETVATPIEQELKGGKSDYFDSLSTNDGQLTLVSTFEVGTNLDIAQVQVQNKVQTAMPKLPEEVRRTGVTVKKQSTDMLMVLSVYSPDATTSCSSATLSRSTSRMNSFASLVWATCSFWASASTACGCGSIRISSTDSA